MVRFEARHRPAFTEHPEQLHRLRETLERVATELRVLESPAQHAPRAWPDDHGAGLCGRLQASRQIGGLPDHGALLGGGLADHVSDHDHAGGDPDAHAQRVDAGIVGGHRNAGHSVHDGQRAQHRALGVVLVSRRISEVGQNAVTHVPGHVAAELPDPLRADILVGPIDLAHVLGVERLREGRRADHVAEHHRELAALPFLGALHLRGSLLHGLGRGGHVLCELRNRLLKNPAVAELEPELFQIVLGQRTERAEIDRVLRKDALVLTEPERLEPLADIGDRGLRGYHLQCSESSSAHHTLFNDSPKRAALRRTVLTSPLPLG